MTKKNKRIAVGVAGARGRMGRAVLDAAAADGGVAVAFAFAPAGDADIGKPLGAGAPPLAGEKALADADIQVLIDFTAPAATLRFAAVCARRGIGMVSGTTGFSPAQLARLKKYGEKIPLLLAQNMSVGVNVMYDLAAEAARRLRAGRLGGGYDMEIFEAHHRGKKDAPSGTALRLGRRLAAACGGDLARDAVFERRGGGGGARKNGDIGFSAARGGDIVGEHRVIFAGGGEQLEIIHRSSSRANYAAGALRAAKFIAAAAPGFYDGMDAVLTRRD